MKQINKKIIGLPSHSITYEHSSDITACIFLHLQQPFW